ncbi:MAG: tetratricopeptide repeat protein [Cyanobacteria bacterium P01_F01_bin.42]
MQKIWPQQPQSRPKPGSGGTLAPAYGQDLQSPEALINRANKRAVRGDIDGAIADFDAAIDLNPAKATTFYNRACLHNLSGNYAQSIADCSEAIALLPEYDEAFYQRGLAQLELKNIDAAIVDLTEVLRLNPYSIKTYYKRASCYAAQEDVQGAVADYTQAILRVPKDANAYLQRGLFLTQINEYQTAVEDFSTALSYNPKSAEAYYRRGCCYAELGQPGLANQDFNQAMLYDPNQRFADSNRSYALGMINRAKNLPPVSDTTVPPARAVPVQDDDAVVLSLDADTPIVMESLYEPPSPTTPVGQLVRQTDSELLFAEGQELAALGNFEAAIESYSKALEFEPDSARAYWERGKSFAALGELDVAEQDMDAAVHCAKQKSLDLIKEYQGAIAQTMEKLRVEKKESSPPEGASSSDVNQPQPIESEIMRHSQDIHQNPLDAIAYFNRAKSRALLGDLDGAIADYTRTISLDPQHREAYYRRGMLLEALGDEEGSTRDLNRAIRRPPLLLPSAGQLQSPQASPQQTSPTADVDQSPESKPPPAPPESKPGEAVPLPSTYVSNWDLEPCTHEGNDPTNRFCIHCGEAIQANSSP